MESDISISLFLNEVLLLFLPVSATINLVICLNYLFLFLQYTTTLLWLIKVSRMTD